jgi:predicted dehydrogenase
MKVAILGSGFGLYGYLPAVASGCGEQVLLPERYRAKLRDRRDVGHLADEVVWESNETAVLDAADAVIVTQRPSDQVRWVGDCLTRPNVKRILLEKPVATDPDTAAVLLDQLARHEKTVRIGYTFRYTPWGRELLAGKVVAERVPVEIDWLFRAHHYATNAQNWKRNVSTGGGAVRFFGIHLIALLAELGYVGVSGSEVASAYPDEAERWQATFEGHERSLCRVNVDSNSPTDLFSIRVGAKTIRLRDPFQEFPTDNGLDRRVSGLTELCRDFLHGDAGFPAWYRASVELWATVERLTRQMSNSGHVGK